MGKDQVNNLAVTDELKPEDQTKMVAEFILQRTEKAKAVIEKQAADLRVKLASKDSNYKFLIVKRMQMQVQKDRINEARRAIKALRVEIKGIRSYAKEKKDGVVVQSDQKVKSKSEGRLAS